MPMRIVITGGGGFVGSSLVRQAVERGHHVVNFDALTASANLADIWDLEDADNYTLVPGDVCDHAAFSELLRDVRPDVVLHLAQEGPHSLSDDVMGSLTQTNIGGTETVLQVCHAQGVARVILAHRLPTPRDATMSLYTASQQSAQLMATAYAQAHKLPVIHSFAPSAFGPRQSLADPISTAMDRLLQGQTVSVVDGPRTALDLIFVEDYAAQLLALAQGDLASGSVRILGPRQIRPLGVVRQICRALERQNPRDAGSYEELLNIMRVNPRPLRRHNPFDDMETRQGGTPFQIALNKTVAWRLSQTPIKRPEQTAPTAVAAMGQAA